MPNKRNGIYKRKPTRDLRGFCLEDDHSEGVGMTSSITEENLNFLTEIFRNVDHEIIQAVLLEFNDSLNESIAKLSEIAGEQSHQAMEDKPDDLAIIACSLLADESQPVGVVSLDICDSSEDAGSELGSAALSSPIMQDQQNLDRSIRGFSLPVHLEESSGDSEQRLHPFVLLKNGRGKSATSLNDNTLWLEKQAHKEVNNCDSYNIYGNENKVFKPKPDFLNSSTDSNNFVVEEIEDTKLRKELVNNLSWFPNAAKSSTNSGLEAFILNTHIKNNTDNSERSVLYENSHKQEINSTAEIKMQSNLDKFYKADLRSSQEVNGTSDLTMFGNLSTSDNLLLNSLSNVSSEWDKFYSDIESDGFSTYCDSISQSGVNGNGHSKKLLTPSVAGNTAWLNGGLVNTEATSSRLLRMNEPRRKRDLKQKSSLLKAADYVDINVIHQSSGAVSNLQGATNSIGSHSSNVGTLSSSSVQNMSIPLGSDDSVGVHTSNLATSFSSSTQNLSVRLESTGSLGLSSSNLSSFSPSAQSNGSSYSTIRGKDHEKSKEDTTSKVKLSPSALEFIPRPIASRLATPLTHSNNAQIPPSSKNQKSDIAADSQFLSALSPRKKNSGNAKKGKQKKLLEDTGSQPCGDQDNFMQPVRLGDGSSHSEDAKQDLGFDHMDPLGWNNIYSKSTSSLLDPKPQRSRKARKVYGEKSSQQAAPDPVFSPWHIPSESQQNDPRSSPPKMKHEELPEEKFSTSFDAVGASISNHVHQISENGVSAISSTQTIGNSPIATRLPPSLTSSAGPTSAATAQINSFVKNANVPSAFQATKKMLTESDVRTQRPTVISLQSQLLKNKLQFRGVKTPVGMIRHYILAKQPVMIILRGLSGSGKSYLARQLIAESQRLGVQGEILSTDDFFMGAGQYSYNRNDLPEAHDWNKKRALQCVKERRSPVIIDNTNTTMWELLPYAVLALEHGYDIQMFEPDTPWRMKVAELARKNVHYVRKENIKRMKERWENFTLEDVIKQASYSVASRKMVTAIPVDSPSVTPAPAEQDPAVNKQMTKPAQASVTEANHQKSNSSIPDPTLQDLGLSDWFSALTQRAPKKMKQKVNLAESPNKNSRREITQDFLNQSLKKAMVNLHSLSPPRAADSLGNNLVPQNEDLPTMNSSNSLCSSKVVGIERQLSDESWSSETPTFDTDVHLFGKASNDATLLQNIHKEKVTVSADFPEEIRQNGEAVTGCALNCSLSTSGSFHTVPSNSDISSYHTEDGDEKGVCLSAISDDDSGDTVPFEHNVQIQLKERYVDELQEMLVDAEALPVHLEKMSLGDEASFSYMQYSSEKSDRYDDNQDRENVSCVVELFKNHSKDHPGTIGDTPALSSTEKSFTAAGDVLNTMVVSSAENIDSKRTCVDSVTDTVRKGGCLLGAIHPSPLVDYSDSDDDDSGQECAHDDDVCKELTQLFIGEHDGGAVDVCGSMAGNGVTTSDVSDGFNCGQVDNSRDLSNEHSTDTSIGLAQDTEIIPGRSTQDREVYVDGSVGDREISLNGVVQCREQTVSRLIQDEEISIDKSIPCVEISSVGLVQDTETTVNRSVQDREIGVQRTASDRESVDRSTPSSEDSMNSGREQSPLIDSSANTIYLQAKKKKRRVRKGRNAGPFIEESLKVISKTHNWSSFAMQSSENSNSSGESVVLEPEGQSVDTWSATTQTDPYDFSIVYKLNSPSFNNLQPVDWTLRGVDVISSSQPVIHEKLQATAEAAGAVLFRKSNKTVDQSTITDETLEKEEVDLETLKSCFPEYSRKQLEATMAICHNDLEWVTSHLLDSPALYDMEDDEEDGSKGDVLKSEQGPALPGSPIAIKSLADMCTMLVKQTNKVDADDLEMQVIQVGEGRLQKIEMFNRYRCHSLSHNDRGGKEYWPDDFLHDELGSSRDKSNFKKRKSKPELKQAISVTTPTVDHDLPIQNGSILSEPDQEKPASALQDQQRQVPIYPCVFEDRESSSSLLAEATASEEDVPASQSSVVGSLPVLPLAFVRHLEKLYGPLTICVDEGGLVLDDSTARKIYNCLKLQGTKNAIKGSQQDQLKKDEALARLLQDEENARTASSASYATISLMQMQTSARQSSVPGWSNQNPSWMTQTGNRGLSKPDISVNISQGNEHFRPHSVADTLRQLRGSQGSRTQFHKFQHRKSGSVKSVWTGSRRRGHVDSLISIMQEEMAREEQQREQLRIIESTGDMEALATRIKRIELSNLFPSMAPDVLEDIFRSTGYSKEETIRILYQSYNIPPVPMSQDKEEILNQLRKSQEGFEHVEDINDEDTPSEDSESSYESYRDEARFRRQLAMDCQQQALRYQSNGMQGAALFYRQRAKNYKEDERVANARAANVLFDKGSERLHLENTLDLHLYRLDEAIHAVNVAIELKEDEYRKRPDKKNSYLDIVTGWGRNSKNGKAKLKPAIIHHLYAKSFQYEEKSPGMLRIYLCKKL
ncbi:hypothetical protein BsWGS_17690 [Bradybaena similaris]